MTRRRPVGVPFHYGWVVVAITFAVMLTASIYRASITIFIDPLELEFGWSRTAISAAASVTLLMYGVAAPILGRLIDRYGTRLILLVCVSMTIVGLIGMVFMTQVWQLIMLFGVLIGLASGSGASVMAAAVGTRWFTARRGVAIGLLSSGTSMGQLIFLPALMWVVVTMGWRAGSLSMALVALMILPIIFWLMRDDPEQVGILPYGATAESLAAENSVKANIRMVPLGEMFRSRTFWLLSGAFFTCGATSNGLIGTHLIPASLENGITPMTAASALMVMGVMSFVGTMASGWLTDRYDPRIVLAGSLGFRALTLFWLPMVTSGNALYAFGLIYGVTWFATVPPVIVMTADTFGKRSAPPIVGWIFLLHQIGAALAAVTGGMAREWLGDYQLAFLLAGVTALIGAAMAQSVKLPPRTQALQGEAVT